MLGTYLDQNFTELLQLLPSEGEFCPIALRTKMREQRLPIEALKRENEHRRILMERYASSPEAQREFAEIISHLSDPGLAHWAKVELLALHELFELKSFLYHYLRLRVLAKKHHLANLHPLPDLKGLFELLDPEGNHLPVFRLSPRYSQRLQKLDDERQSCVHRLHERRLQDLDKAKKDLKMPGLKAEFVLSRNQEDRLKVLLNSKYFVISSENLANISFRQADSPAALKLKSTLQKLQMDIHDAEQQILAQLTEAIKNSLPELKQALRSSLEFTWDHMLAAFALSYGCCIPEIYDPTATFRGIKVQRAVNLPLKLHLDELGQSYQPLDLDFEQSVSLITGPNMGGKSTALKTIALFCQCAARGIPVPAQSALLPIYKHIYYNQESDSNHQTLSTFGREVVAFNAALQDGESTLFLLDEFAKGTNPEEGEALCLATIQHLQEKGFGLIAATHFSAPALLSGIAHFSIRGISREDFTTLEKLSQDNLKERLKLLSQAMDYALVKLPRGQEPPQCAMQIAALLGLPREILNAANNYRNKD